MEQLFHNCVSELLEMQSNLRNDFNVLWQLHKTKLELNLKKSGTRARSFDVANLLFVFLSLFFATKPEDLLTFTKLSR